MISPPRFEAKYRLDACKYRQVRNGLTPYFGLDRVSRSAGGRYLVSSLYYDTSELIAYSEKCWVEHTRTKLRLRIYWSDVSNAAFVKVEQKLRSGRLIRKMVEQVSVDAFRHFASHRRWPDECSDYLHRFADLIRSGGMRPVVRVRYDREAYMARDGSRSRISFDHDIRYAPTTDLFAPTADRRDLSNAIVMEIKTPEDDERLLSELERRFDLGEEPNSKYANAVEHVIPAAWN